MNNVERAFWVLLAALPIGWTTATYAAAERGTPFCLSKLRLATKEAVIRQGAWSYILNKEPSERASLGEAGQGYSATTPIDEARLNAFFRQHPNCCRITPLATSDSFLGRTIVRAIQPNITFVEVKARPQRPTMWFDVFEVDACWDNLKSFGH